MIVTSDIKYIGVNDCEIDLFEGLYAVPNGMSYNSYVILDEKIAVMDTVEENFSSLWFQNMEAVLGERKPDFLIVQHMEPDHSANIARFAEKYPEAILVASAPAFSIMNHFFGTDYSDRRMVVAEKDRLILGKHKLSFITAPMVHWPEVIVTYDSTDKVLFSADGFGKFGVLNIGEEWMTEGRRYYFSIIGKYGAQVQNLLKKLETLQLEIICPLHGPVLTGELKKYLKAYDTWSSYEPEEEGILIVYASFYGNTKKAALLLEEKIREKGYPNVIVRSLIRDDLSETVAEAFRYNKIVLASATYNGGIFPAMRTFLDYLTDRNFGGRTVAMMENGSWAPVAAKIMKEILGKSKELVFTDTTVKILSALNKESVSQLERLAEELCK